MRPSQKFQNPLRGRTRPGARQRLPRTEQGVNVNLLELLVTSHTNTPYPSHIGTQRPLGTLFPVTDMYACAHTLTYALMGTLFPDTQMSVLTVTHRPCHVLTHMVMHRGSHPM